MTRAAKQMRDAEKRHKRKHNVPQSYGRFPSNVSLYSNSSFKTANPYTSHPLAMPPTPPLAHSTTSGIVFCRNRNTDKRHSLIGFDSIRSARSQPSSPFIHRKQKIQMNKEETQDVNVENPNEGKTTAVHKLQKDHYKREIQ